MGRPVLINDQDCDTDLPCPLDDQYLTEGNNSPEDQRTTPMLATIHVVRSIGQLIRTLRAPTISPGTLETFDRHFDSCLATFPAYMHPKSDQDLDPRSLAPVIYLQNARLLLHRHNISPYCESPVRSSAMDHCVSTAIDTANILFRCMRDRPGNADWRPLFASCAGTLISIHIWRCSLFLLFRQEFAAAQVCVQALAAVGDARSVNASCGRYLAFFLRDLIDRTRQTESMNLDQDEEMIAYASGDMQGTGDSSWVWQGSETGSHVEAVSDSHTTPAPPGPETGWEGWDWIEQTVQYLISEKQRELERRDAERQDVQVEPKQEPSTPNPETAGPESSTRSCMNIASII